jgi:hypothetical protein
MICIMNKNTINTPQNRSRLLYPILAGSTWSKDINKRAIRVMNGNFFIKATHIRQCIVNIRVAQVLQGVPLPEAMLIHIAPI